jgi:hypothetical protein
MAISLIFIRWAGEDPNVARLEQLLAKDNLSPEEAKEVKALLKDTDVLIVR